MVNQKQINCRSDYAVKYTKSICAWIFTVMFSLFAANDFYSLVITLKDLGFTYTYWHVNILKIVAFVCIAVGLTSALVQKKEKSVSNLRCAQVGFLLRVVSILAYNVLQFYFYISNSSIYARTLSTYLIDDGKVYDVIIDFGIVLAMVFAALFIQNIIKCIKKDCKASCVFAILCGIFSVLILPLIAFTIIAVFKSIGAEVTVENLLKISSIPSFIRLYACAIIGIVAGIGAFRWISYAKKINNFIVDDSIIDNSSEEEIDNDEDLSETESEID